jgi:hypothetical protein
MVWQQQGISAKLVAQISQTSKEVSAALQSGASGKMISEWAKKVECWWYVRDYKYTKLIEDIPEIKR